MADGTAVGERQTRWPALAAACAISLLHYSMPEQLTLGPGWLVAVITVVFMLPAALLHRAGQERLNNWFAHAGLVLITGALVSSLALLVIRMPQHKDAPVDMLKAAAAIWVCNVLVFASWYWRLDAGGPNERDRRGAHLDGAFLFPQMTMDDDLRRRMGEDGWTPGFVDYLFLAFNTSTAFSPTDVPVLTRWAKVLMMVQASISLASIALLAARAVNIL